MSNLNFFDSLQEKVYIIAEIGQNHQGSFEIAKKMISEAKKIGCDCVKFQKSSLEHKFTKAALERPYISENSWGQTYGEHKKYLEFTAEQFEELKKYSDSIQIHFSASSMDEVSLEQLMALNVKFIKIGSGDANNFPLIEKAAKQSIPLIISTGMQKDSTIKKVVSIMNTYKNTNFALLHCVSSYPTKFEDCNLMMIPKLAKNYPNVTIGYSGHECGIDISVAAVLLGSKIIERHFTLNRTWKGSDHSCSLMPSEFETMVNKIRTIERNFKLNRKFSKEKVLEYFKFDVNISKALILDDNKLILPCEVSCKEKLGKSLVAKHTLYAGNYIKIDDLAVKVSEPNGIPAEFYCSIINRQLKKNILKDDPINFTDLS